MMIDAMEVYRSNKTDKTMLDIGKLRKGRICAVELEEIMETIQEALGNLSEQFGVEFYVDMQFVSNRNLIDNTIHINSWGETRSQAICDDCVKED